jgi:hypothetical protein
VSDVAVVPRPFLARGQDLEKRPDLRRLGVVQFLEDRQRLLPGLARGWRAPEGGMGLAQVDERPGLVVAVAKRAVQGQGPPVAGKCLEALAEVMAGEADAVPGGGLPALVAGLLEHGQGLAGAGQGLPVAPELGEAPAQRVERDRS